jgi:MFS family permease
MSFTSRPSRWADVAIVSAGQLLGGLATFLVMVTQVLHFQLRGASGVEVAALIMCEALPMVLLGKPIGRLVDRVDSRLLLVLAAVAQAAASLALAQVTSLPAVLGVVLALSAASAVSVPTRQALLPAMVQRDDLPRAGALVQTAGTLGMMGGPALAGFLVGGLGPQSTVRLAAVGFLATVVTALMVRTRRGGSAGKAVEASAAAAVAPAAHAGESPVEPVVTWSLAGDPLLRAGVWSLAAVVTAVSAVNVVLVFFVLGTLGSTPQAYGVIDATWLVGLLVGAWLVGLAVRRRTTDGVIARALVVAAGMVCLAVVGVGSAPGPWWIVPCYLVGGAANGAINVLGTTLVGRRVPGGALGRANTALAVRVQGGSLLGYVAGGLLLAVVAPRWIVLGCGLIGLLTALAVLPLVVRVDRRYIPEPERAQADPAQVDRVTEWATGTASTGATGMPTTAAVVPVEIAETAETGERAARVATATTLSGSRPGELS